LNSKGTNQRSAAIDATTRSQLIRLAIEHANRDAVERLFAGHRPRLIRLIMRWIKNRDDAEDITQVVLTKAHLSLDSFQIDSFDHSITSEHSNDVLDRRFTAWLDKIAFRSSIDFARRHKRSKTIQVDSIDDACSLFELPAGEKNDLRESCELFAFAKKHLNQKQYAVLYYCYVDGLTPTRIATQMNSSSLAIRALLFRARRALKSAIRKHGFDHE
jgi:RNA polymerase sigma factor (sigma-70 family)